MLTDRIIGALTFRSGVYDDVEKDTSFTQTAWIIVIVASLIGALGDGNVIGAIIGTIFAVIGFYVFAWIINWVGREVFKANVTLDELIRTLGLAAIWRAVGLLGLIPVLGGLIALIVGLLSLAAWLIATKTALDLEWVQTLVTVVIGFIVYMIVLAIGATIVGILGFGAAVATGALLN
jgi:hypothetical protein